MSAENLEKLALAICEKSSVENLNLLTDALAPNQEIPENAVPAFELIFETIKEKIQKDSQLAKAIINLCSKLSFSNANVRHALTAAIKLLLPPYLQKQGFMRALGLREKNFPAEIAKRFYALMELTNNIYCYNPEAKSFMIVEEIDDLAGTIICSGVTQKGALRVHLEQALSAFSFFKGSITTKKYIKVAKVDSFTAEQWKQGMESAALTRLSDNGLKEMAKHVYIPVFMNMDTFDKWWNSQSIETRSSKHERVAGDARSLVELAQIIQKNLSEESEYKISDLDVERLTALFNRQRSPATLKDMIVIANSLALLEPVATYEQLKIILNLYKTRVPFWPSTITEDINLGDLELWGEITAETSRSLLKITEAVFSEAYLASLSTVLPYKSLNALFSILDSKSIHEAMFHSTYFSSDSLVWIWKNRKANGRPFLDVLNMDHIINAMLLPNLPKAWTAAQRELKKHLINDIEMLKVIIDNHDDVRTIIYAVQRAKGFSQGEQQSLLVKLSRHSPELKEFLEGGEGRRLMTVAAVHEQKVDKVDPIICSFKSYKRLNAELEDLLNRQIPANRVAIEEARAHGDFSENAEYDAAKEVRRYLNAARGKLESDIRYAQPIDFTTVIPEGYVIPGSTVELISDDNQPLVYHIVGAFDSDTDRHWISYRAPLAEVMMGMKEGSKIQLPNGTHATIKTINKLLPEILAELHV